MRKHRHFAVVTAVLLGTGFLAQRFDTPSASAGPPSAGHQSTADGTSRSSPDQVHALALPLHPRSATVGDPMLALTTAEVPLEPAASAPSPAPVPPAATPSEPADGVWAQLRWCESRDDYSDDTGNGYYGAYQFSLATWEGLGLSGLPSEAPVAQQDQAASELQALHGWGQWPACSAALGLT